MEQLKQELKSHCKEIIRISQNILDSHDEEASRKAPLLIKNSFCIELANIMHRHPGLAAADIPEAMDLITAIRTLERLFPSAKK